MMMRILYAHYGACLHILRYLFLYLKYYINQRSINMINKTNNRSNLVWIWIILEFNHTCSALLQCCMDKHKSGYSESDSGVIVFRVRPPPSSLHWCQKWEDTAWPKSEQTHEGFWENVEVWECTRLPKRTWHPCYASFPSGLSCWFLTICQIWGLMPSSGWFWTREFKLSPWGLHITGFLTP